MFVYPRLPLVLKHPVAEQPRLTLSYVVLKVLKVAEPNNQIRLVPIKILDIPVALHSASATMPPRLSALRT
jgi:hypothetical protein